MSPLEASSIFATLVGLICNWRQERAAVATDRFEDFLTWLTNHNFQDLRSLILDSKDVQRELHELLRLDSAELSKKLDFACQMLSSISERIDALSPLARALRAPTDVLSDQALAILKHFDQSTSERMILFAKRHPPFLGLLPIGSSFRVNTPRFLADDIAMLDSIGFIRLVDHNGSGDPIFSLTREGSAFAASLPEITVGAAPPEGT